MRIKNVSLLLFLLVAMVLPNLQSGDNVDPSLASIQQRGELQEAAIMAFSADLPTISMNKKSIDQMYGPEGLNIEKDDLTRIQQAYCYLEFLVKIEKVKKDPNLAPHKNDFQGFLKPRADNKPLIPTQALVDTNGWKAVTVTSQDLASSPMWQSFLKASVCEIFDNESKSIIEFAQTNNQLFTYIPNVETSYATNEFTSLRLYKESIELQSFIQSQQRNRYLAESLDWKNKAPSIIIENINQFKKTDFYTYTHTQMELSPNKEVTVPSPAREHILCYFMFTYLQTVIQNLITLSNAQSMLTQLNVSSLSPNFCFYKKSDLVYINDLLTIQDLVVKNQSVAAISNIVMSPTPNGKAVAAAKREPQPSGATPAATQPAIPSDAKKIDPSSVKISDDPKKQATDLAFEYLPTNSIYESKINEIYGSPGLNIDTEQLIKIKKTYCLLEYSVKLDKVQTDPSLSDYKDDFIKFSLPGQDGLPFLPTIYLVDRDSWKSIPITESEITESPVWQNFLKAMVCDCMDSQKIAITERAGANNQIFSYVPNIETAYTTNDFTTMRLYLESTDLHALMQASQKKQYLNQCAEWKKTSPMEIGSAIYRFRNSDYYKNTHSEQDNQTKTQSSTLTRQVISYFTLITIQDDVYETMNSDNLSSTLDLASNPEMLSNFFSYNSSDFIYLNDFITLKNLIKKNKVAPPSNIVMVEAPIESSQNVVIQKKKGNIFQQFSKEATKVAKVIDKGWKDDFASPITKEYNKANKAISQAMAKTVVGIIMISDALATGLIETSAGFVFITYGFASLFDPSIDPYEARKSAIHVMNKKKAAISTVLGTVFVFTAIFILFPIMFIAPPLGAMVFISGLAFLVGAGVNDKRFMSEVVLGNPIMEGLFLVLMPIFIAMDYLADQFTTGLIEVSFGLTWVGCSFAQALGFDVNPDLEAEKVRADMEKHRSTINIVSSIIVGIIITIVITVLTAGAGTAYTMAATSSVAETHAAGIFARETARQLAIASAKETARRAALETAKLASIEAAKLAAAATAKEAAKKTAYLAAKAGGSQMSKTSAKIALKLASRKAAQAASKKLLAEAAEEATELAIKRAAEHAVLASAKTTAKAGAKKSAADFASKKSAEVAAKNLADDAARIALKSPADDVAQVASKKAAANLLAKKGESDAAKLIAKKAAEESSEAGAKSAISKSALRKSDQAAKAAAKAAPRSGTKAAGKDGAKEGSEEAAEESTKQAAVQAAAKKGTAESADDAAKQAALYAKANPADDAVQAAAAKKVASESADDGAKLAAQQDDLAAKYAARTSKYAKANPGDKAAKEAAEEAAENAAKASANNATKQGAKVTAQQSSDDAAILLAKNATDDAAQKSAALTKSTAQDALAKKTLSESADDAAREASKNADDLLKQSDELTAIAKTNPTEATTAAAKQAADDAAQAATNSTTKQALKVTAQQNTDDAAALATKQASDDIVSQVAARNAASAQDVAAKQAAQRSINQSADDAIAHAAKNPGDKTAKFAAKQARKRATIAQSEVDTVVKTATKQYSDDAAMLASRNATQSSDDLALATSRSQQATQNLTAKKSEELAAKKAAEGFADDSAQAIQSRAATVARESAEETADDAAKALTKASADDVVNQAAAKNAQTLADDATDDLMNHARKIRKAEANRLIETSTFRNAADDGIMAAVKTESLSAGFIIGQVLNAGFGVFTAMGAYLQDQLAQDRLNQERDSIQKLWQFVENNKIAMTTNQRLFIDELHKKHQVAVENQAFGLHYYNNFLNSSVNNAQDQIAQTLAQQYIQMLTPNSQGLKMADIGSMWGLETPFTYLYPSQGFITTTLGRPDFPYAQEVAQAPLTSKEHGKKAATNFNEDVPQATKLWFNQKAISTINQPVTAPLQVEIKFRVIYNLTTAYHIGLYLGGNYHDYNSAEYLQSIQDEGTIDLADEHLAKMFVLKRDDADSMPSLGLYENQGKGWITQDPMDGDILNNSSIYHMSADLNKDQLTVSFWQEDNPTNKWTKTSTVTPCDQRTFGVIFSGLAIEWGVVKPNQNIKQNQQVRVKTNGQSEIEREKESKEKWKQILNPQFGPMEIQSPGKPEILQGHYLYTTQSTDLTDSQGRPITDYVVFATTSSSSVDNIGNSPAPTDPSKTPNSILSLITGNVYNKSGKIVSYKKDALQVFATSNTWLSQQQADTIIQSTRAYQQQMLSLNFGSYELTAISANAIEKGFFIYSCPTTVTTRDASGKPITDYLIMADLIQDSLGSSIGMPPSQAVPGMVSLVTGDVYNKTEATPIDGGYSVMARYAKQYGALPQTISRPVDSAKQSYNATINAAAQAEKDPPISAMASATISFSDLLNAEPPSTGGFQLGLSSAAPSQIIQTKSNISQLQKEAAGTAIIQISDFSSSQPSSFSFNQDQSQPVEASAPSQQTSAFDTSTSIPQQQESTAPESSSTTDAFTLSGSSGFSFGGFGGSGGQAAAVEDIPIVTTAEPTSGRKINFSQQSSIPQTDTSAFEEPIQETISSSQNLPAISTAFDAFNTNPPVQTNISSSSNQSAFDTEFEQPPNQPTESTFDAFNSSPQAQQSVTSSPNQSAFNSDFEQQETSQNESAFDPFNTGQPAQTNVNPSSNQSAFNGGFEQEENQQTNSAFDPFNADQPAQTSSSAFDPFNTDQDSESAFDAPAQTTMTIRNASSDESLSTQEGSAPNSGDFSDEFSLSGSSGFAF